MQTLRVDDILSDKILVSRESARLLEEPLRVMLGSARTPGSGSESTVLAVDFEGVEGITPSFLDELISIFESLITPATNGDKPRLIVANPPTRLSLKFEAVARGHRMAVQTLPDGSWLLSYGGGSGTPPTGCPS